MNVILFETRANIDKTAKAFHKVNDFSRKGIMKAFVENKISDLNVMELIAIFDNWHEGRADLFPEFFPRFNGKISLEESKVFWGEYWPVIFGENGEHWGKDLHDAEGPDFCKLRKRIGEV